MKRILILLVVVVAALAAVFAVNPALFKGALGGVTREVEAVPSAAFVSQTAVRGTAKQPFGVFVIKSNTADIMLNSVTLMTARGKPGLQNVYVTLNGNAFGPGVPSFSSGKETFTGAAQRIKKGNSATVTVYADISSAYTPIPDKVNFSLYAAYRTPATAGSPAGRTFLTNTAKGPPITISGAGKLSASVASDTPASAIVVAGTVNQLFARYAFTAQWENISIKQFDVVVDSDGSFADDPSDDAGVSAVTRAIIKINAGTPREQSHAAVFSQGKASFQNLNMSVQKDSTLIVDILADMNTIEFGAVSGSAVRLGLNEQANGNSFHAVGQSSANAFTSPAYSDSSRVGRMIVRKTVPVLSTPAAAPTSILNGTNEIAAVTVTAKSSGSVALKKLVFQYASNKVGVKDLRLYQKVGGNDVDITSHVTIKNKAGQDLKAGGVSLAGATNPPTADAVSLTWFEGTSDHTSISNGTTHTYILKALVTYSDRNAVLSTWVATDTKEIPGRPAAEVLAAGDYNLVWADLSDGSPGFHSTLNSDWTNGYLVPGLPTQTRTLVAQ